MKIALVHDWLTGMRGGEKALEVLCERFPDAELFTLVHVRGSVSPAIERRPIHTSFVQHLPLRQAATTGTTCRSSRPPIEQFDFDRFDLVLSISHCCVKSVVTPGAAPAPLLLPDADAVRLGPVRRLFRARAARRGRQRA